MKIKLVLVAVLRILIGWYCYEMQKWDDQLDSIIRDTFKGVESGNFMIADMRANMIFKNNYPHLQFDITLIDFSGTEVPQKLATYLPFFACQFLGSNETSEPDLLEAALRVAKQDQLKMSFVVKNQLKKVIFQTTQQLQECANLQK